MLGVPPVTAGSEPPVPPACAPPEACAAPAPSSPPAMSSVQPKVRAAMPRIPANHGVLGRLSVLIDSTPRRRPTSSEPADAGRSRNQSKKVVRGTADLCRPKGVFSLTAGMWIAQNGSTQRTAGPRRRSSRPDIPAPLEPSSVQPSARMNRHVRVVARTLMHRRPIALVRFAPRRDGPESERHERQIWPKPAPDGSGLSARTAAHDAGTRAMAGPRQRELTSSTLREAAAPPASGARGRPS